MSQANLELARRVFDAFNRRDLGAYLALTPFETPLWWVGRWRRGRRVWWRSCGTEAHALEAAAPGE